MYQFIAYAITGYDDYLRGTMFHDQNFRRCMHICAELVYGQYAASDLGCMTKPPQSINIS